MFDHPLRRDPLVWVAAVVPVAVLIAAHQRQRAWGSGWYEVQEWAVELAVAVALALAGSAWLRQHRRRSGYLPVLARLTSVLGAGVGGFLYDPHILWALRGGPARLPVWSWTGAVGGLVVGMVVGVMLARAASERADSARCWAARLTAVLCLAGALWVATLPVQVAGDRFNTFSCGDTYQVAVGWDRPERSGDDWRLCEEAGHVRVLGMVGLFAGTLAAGLLAVRWEGRVRDHPVPASST